MSTISGTTINQGITIGSGYTSPLTITNTGTVVSTSGYVIRAGGTYTSGGATLINAGFIYAQAASFYGINLPNSYVNNSGTIKSGSAGAGGGIDLGGGNSTFINSGLVDSPSNATRYGVLVAGYLHNLATGYIKEGVSLNGTMVNAGTIACANGNGASDYRASIFINSGTITGSGPGPTYGVGILLHAGGTVINSGTISGVNGTAVYFQGIIGGPSGTADNRMVLDAGYTFGGIVKGNPTAGATNTLELSSAAGAGTVTGISAEFVNFGTVVVDANATWTLAGSNTIGSGVTLVDYGSLTISAAQSVSGGMIALKGGSLTDAAGIVINSGALTGAGTVSASTPISGTASGTITASSGTLDLLGAISSGPMLAIDAATASDLKIDNTAAAASAIAISSSNQTLEIGVAGALTIGAAESVTNGTVRLDGGSLTDGAGITIGSGMLAGSGAVSGPIAGAGAIEASGGTLDLTGSVQGSATGLQISNGSNTLKLDSTVAAGAMIAFAGTLGTLQLTDFTGETLTGFSGTVAGMTVGTTGTAPSTGIDLTGATFAKVTSAAVSGPSLVVKEGAATVATLNLDAAPPANTYVDWVSDSGGGTEIFLSAVACFCRGTLILTDQGEAAVEDLAIGDRVVTLSGEAKPVRWIGRRAYDGRFIAGKRDVLPIRVIAGALADGVPSRELWLSPEHSLYLDGVLVQAKHLVNGATIIQADDVEQVEYFHIELESHDILFANGAPAETYVDCDNRLMFANGSEYDRLYPKDDRPTWEFCRPRLEWEDAELTKIRTAFFDRAAALGHAVDTDPDLHLVVDGQSVRPEAVAAGRYRFGIPAGCRAVWLASRRTVPAEVAATSRDTRPLGVPLERLALYDADLSIEAWHGHAALSEGFHDDEPSHRWTDGMARLPDALLRPFTGDVTLDVQLVRSELGYRLPVVARRAATRRRRTASGGCVAGTKSKNGRMKIELAGIPARGAGIDAKVGEAQSVSHHLFPPFLLN